MKSVLLLTTSLVASAPCFVSAQELSHNYIEAGVARAHEDVPSWAGHDNNYDGMYLRGSAALGDTGLYGFGGYRQGTESFGGYDIDDTTSQLGVGYGYRIAPRVELIGEGSYLRLSNWTYSSDTWRASVGVRGAMGDHFEGWAKAHYTDDGFGGSRFSEELGGLYKLTDTWGVTGGIEHGDERDTYTLGMRASF